ncbi:SH3 domain-containing protein [Cohnella sp.]|uniref:C40 family peptidase n=1 Tax=Cohnella sp. TaxID=1883426 RepID=UPI003568B032
MRKELIAGIASLMLFVSVPAITNASTAGSANIVSSVSFRSAPSTSSDVLKYLKAGQSVSVLEVVNNYWIKVRDKDGNVGYISSNDKYVDLIASPVLTSANAVVVSSVSFRTEPSISGDRIRYLQRDEQIVITKTVNSYWYAATDSKGVSGYVSSQDQYVRVTGALPQEAKPVEPVVPAASQQVEMVITAGMKYLGTPYEFRSDRNTTTTFDCSDFVRQAFKDALNIILPADSRQQGTYVKEKNPVTTNWNSLKRGDLMFFMSYKGTRESSYSNKSPFSERITHVGIYLGDGQILQTYSKTSGGVRVDSIAGKHWEYRFLYGGSAL